MEVMIASAPALARLVGEADHRQAGCVTAGAIDQARQATLTAAYHAHPERFGRRPRPPAMPDQYWINQPQDQLTTN